MLQNEEPLVVWFSEAIWAESGMSANSRLGFTYARAIARSYKSGVSGFSVQSRRFNWPLFAVLFLLAFVLLAFVFALLFLACVQWALPPPLRAMIKRFASLQQAIEALLRCQWHEGVG